MSVGGKTRICPYLASLRHVLDKNPLDGVWAYSDQLSNINNCRDLCRIKRRLLHASDFPQPRLEAENARLCSSFSCYFTDKIDKLKLAVAEDSVSYHNHPLTDHLHHGLSIDNLRPVTSTEVLEIIIALLSKCCPLNFTPTSLIKSYLYLYICSVFAHVNCHLIKPVIRTRQIS